MTHNNILDTCKISLLESCASKTNNVLHTLSIFVVGGVGRALGKGDHYIHIINTSFLGRSLSGGNTGDPRCGCSAHLLSMLLAKSTLADEVLHNVTFLLFNGQGQTCFTKVVHLKRLLTKQWHEVLHQFQVAMVSSFVQGIPTFLLTQDGHTYQHNRTAHKTYISMEVA